MPYFFYSSIYFVFRKKKLEYISVFLSESNLTLKITTKAGFFRELEI